MKIERRRRRDFDTAGVALRHHDRRAGTVPGARFRRWRRLSEITAKSYGVHDKGDRIVFKGVFAPASTIRRGWTWRSEGFRMLKQAGAALGLVMVCAAPAWGQLTNSNAPIDLTADQLEVVNNDCAAICWSGAARRTGHRPPAHRRVEDLQREGSGKAGSTNPSCGDVDRIER